MRHAKQTRREDCRVHDCAREHEDPCRGRHPAASTRTRYTARRRSDQSLKNGWWLMRLVPSAFIVLAVACGTSAPAPPPAVPSAQAAASSTANALRSWNDGAAKRGIIDFVSRVTKEGGSDFVPIPER